MIIFGIMLTKEANLSSDTYPIAETANEVDELQNVRDLNYRVIMRLDINDFNNKLIGTLKTYRLVKENKIEEGGIYRFEEKVING